MIRVSIIMAALVAEFRQFPMVLALSPMVATAVFMVAVKVADSMADSRALAIQAMTVPS